MPGSKIIIVILLFIPHLAFAQPDMGNYKGLLNVNYLDERDTLIENIWIDSLHENFSLFVDFKGKKVQFFKNAQGKHIACGTYRVKDNWLMQCLKFEDLNGDGVYETMLGSTPNMNGNQWFNVFIYDSKGDSIVYAGDLSTDYTVDAEHETIRVFYEGSWYMDVYKTLYKWHGNKLIPEKRVVQILKIKDMAHDAMFIDYYINSSHTPNGLKRVSRETWSDKNKKQNALWDDFFNKP